MVQEVSVSAADILVPLAHKIKSKMKATIADIFTKYSDGAKVVYFDKFLLMIKEILGINVTEQESDLLRQTITSNSK